MNLKDKPCSQHPDAPHGFDRNASHNAGRYVCECEGWEPVAKQAERIKALEANHKDDVKWIDQANERISELKAKITEQAVLIEKMDIENTSCRVRIGTMNAQLIEKSNCIKAQAAEIEQLESTINKLLGQLEDAYAGLAGEDY